LASGGRSGEGGFATIALGIELKDDRVMLEPVDRGYGHCLVGEDGIPGAKGLGGGNEPGSALVTWAISSSNDEMIPLAAGKSSER
jgi:hypothetical protein